MNNFEKIHSRLAQLPPLVMYVIGAADALLIVYVVSLVSKFSF